MNESQMIDPSLLNLYDYTFQQNENTLTLNLEYPETFNPKALEINHVDNTLEIGVHDEIPIVCGTLYSSFKPDPKIEYGPTKTTIIFEKSTPEKWNILISAPYPGREEGYNIDPKSAFIIYQFLFSTNNQENQEAGLNYLSISASMGFPPSLKIFASYLMNSEEHRSIGLNYMTIAASRYKDLEAMNTCGAIYSLSEHGKEIGLRFLSSAIESGFAPAFITMAQLLSPFSSLDYPEKDAQKAKEFLEDGLKIEESAEAYHELALIYQNGTEEMKPNQEQALRLQEKAVALDKNTPPLPEKKILLKAAKETVSTKTRAGIGIITLAFIGIVGYSIYKNLHKSDSE